MSTITLYDLNDYVDGQLSPFTIDLDDCSTPDDYLAKVCQGLWDIAIGGDVLSSRCTCCGHIYVGSVVFECDICSSIEIELKNTGAEWIIADYDNIPAQFVGTYALDSDYFEYKKALEASGMTPEAFEAGLLCEIDLYEIASMYHGKHSSDADFARECAEGMGDLPDVWPYSCIDWDYAARELMNDYVAENGHYFSLCY